MLFIFAYYYSGNKNIKKVVTILLLLFIIQDLLWGGRITSLQLIIICFYFNFIHKYRFKYTFAIFAIGIVLMTFIGSIRGNWSNPIEIRELIKIILENKLVLDTAESAFFTSLTFIKVSDLTSISIKAYLLKQFILSLFLGGSVKDSMLALYTVKFISHSFGGILPIYLYFYLGWIGSIIAAIIPNIYILGIKKTKFVKILMIYFVATTPRWYLYSPSSLIRGVLIFGIVYVILKYLDKIIHLALAIKKS